MEAKKTKYRTIIVLSVIALGFAITFSLKQNDSNFKILAVSIDLSGAKAVAPFMKKHNLTFEALIDPAGTIMTSYGVNGIPQSFIIDKQGNIIKKVVGPIDWATPEIFRFFRDLI
jgi:peroxiredoxin